MDTRTLGWGTIAIVVGILIVCAVVGSVLANFVSGASVKTPVQTGEVVGGGGGTTPAGDAAAAAPAKKAASGSMGSTGSANMFSSFGSNKAAA